MTVMEKPQKQRRRKATKANADTALDQAIEQARQGLLAERHEDGHWCYPVESDATVPAEHILMMHFLDEIDEDLQAKLATYLRRIQMADGGWTLYYGGEFDTSNSVKAYYALKLAGDDPEAEHMVRARKAILAHGGAANVNVFALIALAQFEQLPWRAVPYIPVEMMFLPRWAPIHLGEFSYWARTTMVPLFILLTKRVKAKNPKGIGIPELFTVPPEQIKDFFPPRSFMNRVFKGLDWTGRKVIDPMIPRWLRKQAIKRAEAWTIERLNGDGGIGAIFPAIVNSYEALAVLGYDYDHPYRANARKALYDLVEEVSEDCAYTQPCLSPIWDTGLASHALFQANGCEVSGELYQALDWLKERQLSDEPGDWRDNHPGLAGGGWPFQYRNDYYPDLDDTSVVAWAMVNTGDKARYGASIERATNWLCGMQSSNGGFAAFDSDNDSEIFNEIPFADHKSQLDPPTSDVTARLLTLLGLLKRPGDRKTIERAVEFLRKEQEADGSWFGRWGTNYVYGTWSVLAGLASIGEDPSQPYIQRALKWLESRQNADGGWGEDNGSYFNPPRGDNSISTTFQTAWGLLGLMAWGEYDTPAIRRGVDYLLRRQEEDGLWYDPQYTAPGFPAFFYLKYHGYTRYFPLWALGRYRNLKSGAALR